jgi:hypothetical protein
MDRGGVMWIKRHKSKVRWWWRFKAWLFNHKITYVYHGKSQLVEDEDEK